MRKFFIALALLVGLGRALPGQAQGKASWYAVQNNVLVLKSGSTVRIIKDAVTLPNGNRLEPLVNYVVLPTGEHAALGPDDVVLPSGDIVRVQGKSEGSSSAPAGTRTAAARPNFAYAPPAPVGGKLRGVVELGASGFNSFIARVDAQHRWKLEKVEYGNSLVLEHLATDDDVRRGLKAYIGRMLDFGVDGHDIHFIVSSGAAQAEGTAHIIQTLKQLGYVVNVVTPEQEGALGLRAALPAVYADKAFLVDMGSANTKIGWLDHGVAEVLSTHGSKFYQQGVNEAAVVADVKAKAAQVPATHRQTCFVLGGVPFELAKPLRQDQEPYTVLKAPAEYSALEGAKLKSGQTIYQALADATGCQQFVFVWDGNFTLGYLLTK